MSAGVLRFTQSGSPFLLWALLAALALPFAAEAKRFTIIVNADAEEEYMERSESLEYQTYHFVKGEFFGGFTRDKGLESTQFEEIAQSVAQALEKRKFYPEPDKNLGDLMIMISWGRTALDPDFRQLMGIDSAGAMLSASAQDQQSSAPTGMGAGDGLAQAIAAHGQINSSAEMMLKDKNRSQMSKNIALLGLGKDLRQEYNMAIPRDELWGVLEQERYFIVLNAFDYQHLLKHKELKQVWSARYSTRAVGLGFRDAVASMNHAVGGVLGLKLDKLSKVKGNTQGGGTLGEIEVLGSGEDENAENLR